MRNKILDVLNGAAFITKHGGVQSTTAILRLMDGVRAFPNENWVDAFSEGQTTSKQWLLDSVVGVCGVDAFRQTIMVGGWVGLLPLVISAHGFPIDEWHSIDISDQANKAAVVLNPVNLTTHTTDMYDYQYQSNYLVINTSCEHIPSIRDWLAVIPSGCRVVLQSNNMFGIEGHINCVDDEDQLLDQVSDQLSVDLISTLPLPWHGWKRFMVIGVKQ